MDTIENTRAALGSNQPPTDDLVAMLRERLETDHGRMVSRRDDLLSGVARVPETIEDDEVCGKVGDFVKQITGTIKDADGTRIKVKEPYLEAGRAVDGFFKGISEPLEKARKTLLGRVTTYERAKADRERRAREEEARRVAAEAEAKRKEAEAALKTLDEAAATADADQADVVLGDAIRATEQAKQASADALTAQRAAEVKPAELSRVRGDYGSVSSLRTFWDFADLDRERLDLGALRAHLSQDALEKAVRSFIKVGGRTLAGVRIFENTSAVIR